MLEILEERWESQGLGPLTQENAEKHPKGMLTGKFNGFSKLNTGEKSRFGKWLGEKRWYNFK